MHKHNDFCPLNTSHVVSIWMQFSSVLWLLKDDVNSNDPSRSPVEDVGTWHWIFNSPLYIPIFVHASLIEQFRFEATRNNWLMMLPYSVLASGQKDEHQLEEIWGLSWARFCSKLLHSHFPLLRNKDTIFMLGSTWSLQPVGPSIQGNNSVVHKYNSVDR